MSRPRTRQTLLDHYLQPEKRRGPYVHFFDLPPFLRERIYKDACRDPKFWATGKIAVALEGKENAKDRWHDYATDIGEFETGLSLLMTCRIIHDEMFNLIYTRNDFVVYGETQAGMDVLRRLGPRNLASLSQVIVYLDFDRPATPSVCHYTGCGRKNCLSNHQAMMQSPQHVHLQNWHNVLYEILPHLRRSNFCLNLICNFERMDLTRARSIGRQLLTPLHGRLTLSACSISLSPSPNMELRVLAEEVAMRATGQPPLQKQRLSLLDLPCEIRLQILGYTDLVTKRKEVEWRPGQGYWTWPTGWCGRWSDDISMPMRFCRRAHAAYTSHCRCWLSPLPLFLTCKALSLEAEQVFFQRNRIVIKPEAGINCIAERTPPVLAASHYLRNVIPARALRHLRFLEIVFSPLQGAFLQETEPAYQDWLSALDFVKDKLLYQRLTLRVYFSAWAPNHASYGSLGRPPPSDKSAEEIFESYRRTLFPLSILRGHGLRNLLIDLASPFWLHLGEMNNEENKKRWNEWMESVEMEIETRIMGDGYTPVVSNARDSLWRLVWSNFVFDDGCRYDYRDPTMVTTGL